MKLVVAIIDTADEADLTAKLNSKGYCVTRLASTGVFLRKGNCTLLIGIEDHQLPQLLDFFKSYSQRKKIQMIAADDRRGFLKTSGIVIFVLQVEQFVHF